MRVFTITAGPIGTNTYLVADDAGTAAIIDPAIDSIDRIERLVKHHGFTVEKILITHSHWDHIGDCASVKRLYKAPVYVHELDVGNLRNPGSDGVMGVEVEGVEPDHFFGDQLSVGDLDFEIMHTPGHCRGMVCLYSAQEGMVFCGDLLFRGWYGRTDLTTSEPEKMGPSIKKIISLPPETIVYSGHGESTTIGEEMGQWEYL